MTYYFNPRTVQVRNEKPYDESIQILKDQLDTADAVVIGAGAGLSTAAGYTYTGKRMQEYFSDFAAKYGIRDMYSGGFYPYQTMEEFWGFWCRYIWINRYAPIPGSLYTDLLDEVKDKDYFVLTTNVDHCFQRAGFDKHRLFYTQGDYGLFQSSRPSGQSKFQTYDNEDQIREMVLSQGWVIDSEGNLHRPEGVDIKMTIPSELVPVCPDDGNLMTTNLRSDDLFVEDKGWHVAEQRYEEFLDRHKNLHVLYWELGVGMNTPVIIKFPFWKFTEENKRAFYACVNYNDAGCGKSIVKRSVCIEEDFAKVQRDLK